MKKLIPLLAVVLVGCSDKEPPVAYRAPAPSLACSSGTMSYTTEHKYPPEVLELCKQAIAAPKATKDERSYTETTSGTMSIILPYAGSKK